MTDLADFVSTKHLQQLEAIIWRLPMGPSLLAQMDCKFYVLK